MEYTVYDYWHVLIKRKWIVIISTIIVVFSSYYFKSRQKPVYKVETVCEISNQMSYGAGNTGYYSWYPGEIKLFKILYCFSPDKE